MVTVSVKGITLSANATANESLFQRFETCAVRKARLGGDFADSEGGRARRAERRNKRLQRSFFSGL